MTDAVPLTRLILYVIPFVVVVPVAPLVSVIKVPSIDNCSVASTILLIVKPSDLIVCPFSTAETTDPLKNNTGVPVARPAPSINNPPTGVVLTVGASS